MKWKLVQAFIGLGLMAFSYDRSHEFELFLKGRSAQGTIMRFQETDMTLKKGPSSSTFQPIVRFEVSGKSYQFKNYFGSNSSSGIGNSVPVIYSSENPEIAIIDQGWRNYIPWVPIFLMGFLVFMGAIQSRTRIVIPLKDPETIDEAHRLALEGRSIEAIKVYRKATGRCLKDAKDYIDHYLKNHTPRS